MTSRGPNTDSDKFHKGYGDKDYAHAKAAPKKSWTYLEEKGKTLREQEYMDRLAKFKNAKGLFDKVDKLKNVGKTYEFQKGDTLFPALKNAEIGFGMNDHTALYVMTRMLAEKDINVDLVGEGDSVTITKSGDLVFQKKGGEKITISNILKPGKVEIPKAEKEHNEAPPKPKEKSASKPPIPTEKSAKGPAAKPALKEKTKIKKVPPPKVEKPARKSIEPTPPEEPEGQKFPLPPPPIEESFPERFEKPDAAGTAAEPPPEEEAPPMPPSEEQAPPPPASTMPAKKPAEKPDKSEPEPLAPAEKPEPKPKEETAADREKREQAAFEKIQASLDPELWAEFGSPRDYKELAAAFKKLGYDDGGDTARLEATVEKVIKPFFFAYKDKKDRLEINTTDRHYYADLGREEGESQLRQLADAEQKTEEAWVYVEYNKDGQTYTRWFETGANEQSASESGAVLKANNVFYIVPRLLALQGAEISQFSLYHIHPRVNGSFARTPSPFDYGESVLIPYKKYGYRGSFDNRVVTPEGKFTITIDPKNGGYSESIDAVKGDFKSALLQGLDPVEYAKEHSGPGLKIEFTPFAKPAPKAAAPGEEPPPPEKTP
ncbi:hypothetical protein HZA42_02760 [Candidatus Peregrinibacteria bacterium]|nr:hypothetical protein [Candidatus Peregrinibacteria bacterium]